MIEKFDHIQSAHEKHMIGSENLSFAAAQFISNPVTFLQKACLEYLDEFGGDTSTVVDDFLAELDALFQYATETFPQIMDIEPFASIVKGRDAHDYNTVSRTLFNLFKDAGFTYEELKEHVSYIPKDLDARGELNYRGDAIIVDELYGKN